MTPDIEGNLKDNVHIVFLKGPIKYPIIMGSEL